MLIPMTSEPILSEAPFGSVPRAIFEQASTETKRFSSALILDGQLAGSGTFIKWESHHGILTAHHVIHNPRESARKFNFTSDQRLALQVEENREHWFELDMRACRCVDVGIPATEADGPDLSVIILPEAKIGTLKAKKDFYNIEAQADQKLKKALSDTGAFLFSGCPESKSDAIVDPFGGRRLIVGHTGACTLLNRRYEHGGFDFLELNVSYHPGSDALTTFAGMSGGGVWRIPLFKRLNEPLEKVRFDELVLAGVVFLETGIEGGKQRIRCHGGKSIFINTLQALRKLTT